MCHEYAGRWYVWVRVPKYKSVRVIVLSERGGLVVSDPPFWARQGPHASRPAPPAPTRSCPPPSRLPGLAPQSIFLPIADSFFQSPHRFAIGEVRARPDTPNNKRHNSRASVSPRKAGPRHPRPPPFRQHNDSHRFVLWHTHPHVPTPRIFMAHRNPPATARCLSHSLKLPISLH